MSQVWLLFALLLKTILVSCKSAKNTTGPNCQSFSKGVTFNDLEAVGTWHLLHFMTAQTKGAGDPYCIEFTNVAEQERKDIQERIGKFVENLNWETLSLKMQIPCKSVHLNKTSIWRDYYLERLDGNGSYRTLQTPAPTAKLDIAKFHRYPIRLKAIEGQYLVMMDCNEKFIFILGKQPPESKELDDRLKKMIETYWPEEL